MLVQVRPFVRTRSYLATEHRSTKQADLSSEFHGGILAVFVECSRQTCTQLVPEGSNKLINYFQEVWDRTCCLPICKPSTIFYT